MTSSEPVVFTGIGGDEMLALRSAERSDFGRRCAQKPPRWLGHRAREQLPSIDEDLAPVSVLHETSLLAFACRNPIFLRAGRWPVSPLCDPELVLFGQWLPMDWRVSKRLARVWLERLGLSNDVVYPALRENFAGVMQRGLRLGGLSLAKQVIEESVLVDLGLVDGDAMRAAVDEAEIEAVIDTSLYDFLAVERGLRSLLGA
ncbi:hypothetical protein TL08_19615 [Actinoalloteichus hymeniacidonis]|uniref:Asparagine synthase n=2 Tax=Actinoalloteichus hymeniacidonis TaxID=340345 RepID=A0AAC9HSE8_9PSEU|nr:hypothetical protein TL08_19615 [Actinoalloteichus hymeniacidonis]